MKPIVLGLWVMLTVVSFGVSATDHKQTPGHLAKILCAALHSSGNYDTNARELIGEFLTDHEGIKNPSKTDRIEYLNQNKNEMTCAGMLYTKVAYKEKKYKKIFSHFIRNRKIPIVLDLNAFDRSSDSGIPETLIDYFNTIINEHNADPESSRFREREIVIIRHQRKNLMKKPYYAKTCDDLPECAKLKKELEAKK